jgi:hypothetical protein
MPRASKKRAAARVAGTGWERRSMGAVYAIG